MVYSVEGLPPGIAFDADGTGACSAARTICGTATLVGESAVTVWATDAVGAKRTALNFTITVTAADPPIAAAHAVTLGATTRAATLDPPTIVVDEGAASTYTVVLASQPSGSVTVTVVSDNTDVTADSSATAGVQATLTFSTTNWNTAQTVAVTVAEDAGSGDEAATLAHTASGGGYGSATYALFVAAQDDEQTGTDYDADEDGLIEIRSLAQLNAIRWDLDGDGAVTGANADDYANAFPAPAPGMGCPDGSDAGDVPDSCTGYELTGDLDFDTDGDDDVDADDPNSYPNWAPIGGTYSATFNGNHHRIDNLTINRADSAALFSTISGQVRKLGLPNVNVRATGAMSRAAALADELSGTALACWSAGRVFAGESAGGLVNLVSGRLAASFSAASVHITRNSFVGAGTGEGYGGGLAARISGTVVASYAVGAVRARIARSFAGDSTAGSAVHNSYATGAPSLVALTSDSRPGRTGGFGASSASSHNYCDRQTTGQSICGGAFAQNTSQMQTASAFPNWDNLDVDGDGARGEDPWDYGARDKYPVLSYAGFDTAFQFALQLPPPDFGSGSVPAKTARVGVGIQSFQVPAASHGSGAVAYRIEGLPPGLSFDAYGAGACSAQRTICGAPARTGSFSVTVWASDAIGAKRTALRFTITVGGIEIDADPSTASTVDPGPLALSENEALAAHAKRYAVRLTGAPSAAVTVTITSADTGAVTVDDTDGGTGGVQNTLSFSTADWNTWQTVTARAVQDADALDESLALTHAASGGGYDGVSATLTAVVDDDEVARLLLDRRRLLLDEGAARVKRYAVKLSRAPSAPVTVMFASDNPAVSSAPAQLTFNAANWNTGQTVAAQAAVDADAVDETARVTHTASGASDYDGVSATLRVAVRDSERTGTDYDADEDGLIEIDSLAKLNAVRWDLNGDGAVSAGDATNYGNAFRGAAAGMGCPDGPDANESPDACIGYELTRDLDFDTDDDGSTWTEPSGGTFTADSGDAYYNGGAGWDPLGWRWAPSDTTNFTAIFDGNGHVIENLLVNRSRDYSGLFAALRPGAVVRSLGLPNARVRSGHGSVAPLAGTVAGRVAAVWASGAAAGQTNVGGLVGTIGSGATVVASYSTATASCVAGAGRFAGGLAAVNSGTIAASYATGAVTGDCPAANRSGLASGAGAFTASYWDVDRSGIMDDAGTASPEGETSANMRAPTGYAGIYASWDDQDVDGNGTPGEAGLPAETGDDDAWDFGERWQWPVLKFGGLDVARQFALQPNEPPTFGSGTVPSKTFRRNMPIAAFQVPAASGGELAIYTYSATGLPAGLSFGAPNCAARTVCGTPTANTGGAATVTIHAHDGDTNLEDSDRATLMFTITVVTPTAALTSRPATLTEANLDGAEVTVTLTNTTFASGVTKSSFRLNTTVRGLTVRSLATVTAGDAVATLTLDYNGTDFDAVRALGVTVAASAHTLAGALTTAPVAVAPSLEITATPPSLALTEAAGAANTGTFTAVLDSAPAANTTVAVTSSDAGAATVDPSTLTFTAQNWSTAQTVTVSARDDDDPDDESPTITLSTAGVGTLATVAVKVTDDDRGAVLIDADPATPALDAGPLLLSEGDSAGYAVRLSAAPSGGNATVAVTSSDAGAVTVDQSSLTFTTRNWNIPQTVTATAVTEASDAVDESVIVTHAATGGGYVGASARLRVAVSDAQRANTDYDTDENGLIEVSTLAQLDAMRWDLDGDGTPTTGDGGAYANAFPQRAAGMGCPAVADTATCTGYELTQDLDFDTDGDGSTHASGTSDADDTYHNGGAGWDPIGPASAPSDSTHFNATFDGNGHAIHNLYVNRSHRYAGLFGGTASGATVRSLGVARAYVNAWNFSGVLSGENAGRIAAVWTSGSVRGGSHIGGMVGAATTTSTIVASYSKASAQCTGTNSTDLAGGLAGTNAGTIVASYSTGAVTGACPTANKHGLAGGAGTATASHWDRETSGTTVSAQGVGRTTAHLQAPTSATGIYAGWDQLDVDGDGDPRESPWHFGKRSEYPALRYRGADPVLQRGDYDTDDNGLIEVRTLAQLNAIRWDLDGDGAAFSLNAGLYRNAFRNHAAGMGCPTSTDDADDNDCAGYELGNDLDFDTDGDGSTHTGGAGDSGDAYHNGGVGWLPIGSQGAPYTATFDGNGRRVSNLFINRSQHYAGLFGNASAAAEIRSLGVVNGHVAARNYSGLLVGENAGRIAAVWTSGSVRGGSHVGGLAGSATASSAIVASYSTASAACTGSTSSDVAGGLAGTNAGTIAASYATGAVTGACPNKHGLAGGAGTFTASYWDVNRSGIDDDSDAVSPEGETSENLRAPTGYTGIYAAWDDQDVDGDNTAGVAADADDDAWNFGDEMQWPVLKFGGHDVAGQVALQPNVPPIFTGTVADRTYRKDFEILTFQVPAASGGEGVGYTYSASGLPPGLVFEGVCGARGVCGTPRANTAGAATVTIYAHDGDTNRAASDRDELTFTITVVDPTAALTSRPATLTEANLDGAEVTVTLTDITFAGGVTKSSFMLNTNVSGLTVGSVATVTAGDTSATLTLAYDDTDFDTARTLGVTVVASAHALAGALTTGNVPVSPAQLEATVSPSSLQLNEATGSNSGSFTVVLDSAPAATTTVAVASADPGAATVDVASLTFTALNWSTAQTVTVTAQADDDSNGESTTITLSAAGVGTLATVAVTVADDDAGTVLIDADPSTPGVDDPGPVLLVEGGSNQSYTVRLSARPTVPATVVVASDDLGAARINRSPLVFTTRNWNTPQTVTVRQQSDADALDESVIITHTATGGGYGGTVSRLRVAISDDERTGTDFDTDNDGLIEISTLAQLNAIRWDLDGDGAPSSGNAANYSGASGAFANASTDMGCPAVSGAATCTGYELTQDLDFDTDGDGATHTGGTSDSDDAWHNGGNGWDPIGPSVATTYQERLRRIREESFNAVFDGNGHAIHNLYINRGRDWAALFSAVRADGVVRSLGLPNAYVDGGVSGSVAALAGTLWGRVEAAWATGAVEGGTNVGGLVGSASAGSTIVASYSKASADCGTGGAGGLVGHNAGAIVASYATGAVTGSGCQTRNKHGLAAGAGTATASHWDREASGVTTSAQGAGRATAQLKTPTSATGIFAGWDAVDVDGDGDPHESPWHFGTSAQYPVLSHRGMDPIPQRGDYDLDDDGLIEVYTLAQLNAVRWDLDGDGAPFSGNVGSYAKAFRNHVADMGCPTNGDDANDNDCIGYELDNDLDFDTDGNGEVNASDPHSYSNWTPIGGDFSAIFDGNHHAISNLTINRAGNMALFSTISGTVRELGLADVDVRATGRGSNAAALADVLSGTALACWSTGSVVAGEVQAGGLVRLLSGRLAASFSAASVRVVDIGTTGPDIGSAGGLAAEVGGTGVIVASYAVGAVTSRDSGSFVGQRNTGGTIRASYATGLSSTSQGFTGVRVDPAALALDNYCDYHTTGQGGCQDATWGTTSQMQSPTSATGVYANWDDLDVNGNGTSDEDPWDFGASYEYPVLSYAGLDPVFQFLLQPSEPPTFGAGTVPDKTFRKDFPIDAFQVPMASGGEVASYTYSASGLPAGLSLGAPSCAARTVCGTPTRNTAGAATVTIYAHDGDINRNDSDRAALMFTITVVEPTAAITSRPATLTEAMLDDATVTVTLTDTTFASGVTASDFMLNTNVSGLTVGSLATVAPGDAAATLTLAYDDTDFDTARTLGVTVAAAAHSLPGAIATASVAVAPSLEATATPSALTLNEATGSNTGMFDVVLDSDPGATTTVAVASADTGAATVDKAALTFTTTDWNSAQTVTVTARADDDANDETVPVTLTASGVGVLARVTVTVTDDDRGTVLIDADPATTALDPGPAAACRRRHRRLHGAAVRAAERERDGGGGQRRHRRGDGGHGLADVHHAELEHAADGDRHRGGGGEATRWTSPCWSPTRRPAAATAARRRTCASASRTPSAPARTSTWTTTA